LLRIRSFSSTYPSLGKHDKRSTIRVPSKKAAAAKARRRAAVAAAEDAKAEKMTLAKAISVLRV
jgi:large subunit ribosomal protein L1